jgi:hypothetical protein
MPYRDSQWPRIEPGEVPFSIRIFAFFTCIKGGWWVRCPDGPRYALPDPLPPVSWFGPSPFAPRRPP